MWIFRVLGFVVNLIIFYIIGCFIAMDLNPLNWWIITTIIGRILFCIFIVINIYANFIKDETN